MDLEVKRKVELDGIRNALLNTIPDGMTNGDVIELLFASVWNETEEFFQEVVSWYPILPNGLGDEVHFDKDWWYAPFVKGENNGQA